jgi:lipoate-protein ligase A
MSYGVAVPDSAPYVLRARREGIPTVHRSTGGTGLLHEPGDLAWSIVLPRDDPRVGRQFVRAFGRFGRGVVRFLGTLGVAAEWTEAPGLDRGYCTLSARGSVLASRDRILGGAAQHLTGNALLHHGAISLTVDRGAIDRLFGLSPGGPSCRLQGLRELGIDRAGGRLAAGLVEALAADLYPDSTG